VKKRIYIYIHRIKEILRLRLDRDRTYQIGFFHLQLPAEHQLPEHQSENRLYDRFLPFIAALLPKESTVIDIGANIGDTLASMVSKNSNCSYVCIEPEDKFFPYLVKTRLQILEFFPHVEITLHQEILSSTNDKRGLIGGNGTRTAKLDELEGNPSVSLDSIVELGGYGCVSLLKVDVDGWDWDVILSSRKLIESQHPIIFFEMGIQTSENLTGYKCALMMLKDFGYTEFFVFDSFGAYIFYTSDIEQILEFGEYLLHQDRGETTRTMYYLDILCGVIGQGTTLENSVSNFVAWGVAQRD